MRAVVKCLNCGIVWVRVTTWGPMSELTEDLMYLCPNCNSNWYESYEKDNIKTSLKKTECGTKEAGNVETGAAYHVTR